SSSRKSVSFPRRGASGSALLPAASTRVPFPCRSAAAAAHRSRRFRHGCRRGSTVSARRSNDRSPDADMSASSQCGGIRLLVACVAAIGLTAWLPTMAQSPVDFTSDVVFTGDRGHVHASSIVETPSGALLAVWYENGDPTGAGPFEGQDLDKRE